MKTVLYTQRVEIIESYQERRDCADQRIPEFLSACSYLPVPVPNVPEVALGMMEELKPIALVFSGGNNLAAYDGDAPERDLTERELLRLAAERDIPVYGFCRGMQMILDYYGEKLIRVQGHIAKDHEIRGDFGNRVVNSYHSLALRTPEKAETEVLARSDDGLVEAVRIKGKKILGTMWHPERRHPFEQRDIRMVRAFFEEGRTEL